MKKIAVLTSGGDAPGMNACIRAVVRTALYYGMEVYGVERGYTGLMNGDFVYLTSRSVSDMIHKGGTFLKTARCPEFVTPEGRKKAAEEMKKRGIEGLVVIGGDGSFHGGQLLSREFGFKVVGIPGTIDNDLAYTDYTLGFDTAVNTACECVNRIRETSESHERASLITVMGRNCGDIAVHTALACGAEYVMVPEAPWSIEEIAERIKWGVLNGKRSTILVMAEGAFASLTSDVNAICAQHEELKDIATDTMTGFKLASIIEALSGQETRATVLGYIQRGGSPSAQDRILGSRFGARAVELLKEDTYGRAIGIRENRIIDVPFSEAVGHPQPLNRPLMDLVGILGK